MTTSSKTIGPMTTSPGRKQFWDRVEIRGPHDCWEWKLGLSDKGYGRFNTVGKTFRAHRVAWTLHSGRIPGHLCVCHHCDNPVCCNPAHLFLGTHIDNVRDCASKGRRAIRHGNSHSQSKLTSGRVRLIRAMRPAGFSMNELAEIFQVGRSCIADAASGRRWAHVQ